jgi:uncharacterized protein YuzE
MSRRYLLDLFPKFAEELQAELMASGEEALAGQVSDLTVLACSYDAECSAAYIRVESALALNTVEANIIGARHRRTIPVKHQCDVYLDADNFNRITGIELLDACEYAEQLLAFRAA